MPKLTEEQKAELDAIDKLPDDQIDASDIPTKPIDWSKAKRGVFYRPVKQEITLKLDEYVVNWFKDNTPDGQDCLENINQALLGHIRQQRFPPPDPAKETTSRN